MSWESAAALLCPEGLWNTDGSLIESRLWLLNGMPTEHARPLADFLSSAGKGCSGCTMLLHVVEEVVPGWAADESCEKRFIRLEHHWVDEVNSRLLHVFLVDSSFATPFTGANRSTSGLQPRFSWRERFRGLLSAREYGTWRSRNRDVQQEVPFVVNVASTGDISPGNGTFASFALLCTQTGRSPQF